MKIPEHRLLPLVRQYLQANAGNLLPGFVHNMNNYLQVLDMQLELISRKGPSGLSGGAEDQGRLERLLKSVEGLTVQLKCADKRHFYSGEEQTQINLPGYLAWLKDFWDNNLYFKHHVQLSLDLEPDIPSLEVPPLFLTFCLEEPLKNALESCQAQNSEGDQTISMPLRLFRHEQGVAFQLISPTRLPRDITPWEMGSTTKPGHLGIGLFLVEHYARLLGWSVSLEQDDATVRYTLSVPHVRTLPPDQDVL